MKAITYSHYGPPSVLQLSEVSQPVPTETEVLIKVHATTVNRTDCAQLRAKPFIMRFFTGLFTPRRKILGTAFSGEIVATGKAVTNFEIGDRVFGLDDDGLSSYAEFMTFSADKALAIIPDNISYQQAAASSEGLHYAYNFINKVHLSKEKTVLVNGATGAIGTAAMQLLKYYGNDVVAVCNTKNMDLIKSFGASRTIDYTKENFLHTHHEYKYDFIFDMVGKSSFFKCRHLLKPNGTYISTEFGVWAQNALLAIVTPLFKGKQVRFPIPTNIKHSIVFTRKLMAENHYTPVIDKIFPLEDIAKAFEYVETGEKTGNVIITV